MGIDVRMSISYWFRCNFKEPDSSIHMLFPRVVFSKGFQSRDHLVTGSSDWTLPLPVHRMNFFLGGFELVFGSDEFFFDLTFTEPAELHHSDVVVTSLVELGNEISFVGFS